MPLKLSLRKLLKSKQGRVKATLSNDSISAPTHTYIVEFVADYLGITSIAVPAGYCPFKRPEQSVIHLEEEIKRLN